MKDLKHFFEDNLVFEDPTLNLNDYLRGFEELKIKSDDYWYIGLYKPFNSLFFEAVSPNISQSELVIEYWDGTMYQSVPNILDDTSNFTRSGFIRWMFDDSTTITQQWRQNDVNGTSLNWIRISSNGGFHGVVLSNAGVGNSESVINIDDDDIGSYQVGQEIYIAAEDSYHSITAVDPTMGAANITIDPALVLPCPDAEPLYALMSVKGMNLVYADDNDLISEVRLINDFLAEGDTSFISYHVAARNEIVQTIRNGGYVKQIGQDAFLPQRSEEVLKRKNMNKWDFLDIDEIRQAGKYLALAKIFFDVSENTEDKAYQRYRDYEGMYGAAFKLFYMSLDLDDDGNEDKRENLALNDVTVTKV
jgi:hypothetical protein